MHCPSIKAAASLQYVNIGNEGQVKGNTSHHSNLSVIPALDFVYLPRFTMHHPPLDMTNMWEKGGPEPLKAHGSLGSPLERIQIS